MRGVPIRLSCPKQKSKSIVAKMVLMLFYILFSLQKINIADLLKRYINDSSISSYLESRLLPRVSISRSR